MSDVLKIAARNLSRYRRRTLLTLLLIAGAMNAEISLMMSGIDAVIPISAET